MKQVAYTKSSLKRLIRYGIVGVLAFSTEFLSFLALYNFLPAGQFKLAGAQTLSFILGLMVSFTGSRQYTFNSEQAYHHSVKTQMAVYFTLAIINLLISNLLIYVLVHGFAVLPIVAKVIVMASVALWNFVIFNKFVFKTK